MTDDLAAGLYELLVTEALNADLAALDAQLVERKPIRPAEAADRIALHIARQVERVLESVADRDRVDMALEVSRRLLAALAEAVPRVDSLTEVPVREDTVLHSIGRLQMDGSVQRPARPLIPLLDTVLLTNAPDEPRVGSQILAEIESADAIDVVMAFVLRSGLRPLVGALRDHCAQGKPLRVLTTTYTGSTEAEALDLLRSIGAEVRVSYDVSSTRLHAKSWLFHRKTAFTTAYVGSSNLSHSAQLMGMEWNVRLSDSRNRPVIEKVAAVFESYWQGGDFVPYDRDQFDEAMDRSHRSTTVVSLMSPLEVRLQPFQERLLELIEVSRRQGRHRNLLVSATGTGKTVMAAVDYARLRQRLQRDRLLFVAHREEILDQSLATFRHALRDPSFGEKWVGRSRPRRFDHVFASIQSLNAAGLDALPSDHFDVVIVDEFHHAAAQSYRRLLDHLQPRELLGLTATPERSDGLPILHWFDDRIAAELRLWDAIDEHRLSPFVYYGIHDGVDLRQVPWRRGRGYDVAALSDVYTSNDIWARFVVQQVVAHVDDMTTMRCLGFCVSVDHARYMARQFTSHGIRAVAVWGDSSEQERAAALRGLADGSVQVVFSVDLFNEGVDVPAVDVVLMLRPTESATLFLQQLGRGLRIAEGKSFCTVLDFVGQHRREFRFDLRYRALLGGSRTELERAIERGFPYLPAGCHLELDRQSADIVLRSIREAIPSRWNAKVAELRLLSGGGRRIALGDYLRETGLDLEDVYSGNRSWSDLQEDAGVAVARRGEHETALRRAVGRLTHLDDDQRVRGYAELLADTQPPRVDRLSALERRLARMLTASLADQVLGANSTVQDAVDLVWRHPQIRAELAELLQVRGAVIDHLHESVPLPDVPLQVHGRYTRIEILAAVGEGSDAKTPQWREGVYDAKGVGADLLAFTLDKTNGDFSPTTRYRDYAISPELIHWESQSTTRANSPTGQRYQHHEAMGRSILLFARSRQEERAFWFLGPASYVKHEGERPMAVTWRLHTPLPGDLFTAFAAAVA